MNYFVSNFWKQRLCINKYLRRKKKLKIKMKTVPQICILLLLIIENQAQESPIFLTKAIEEEVITENSTVSREVELIAIENSTRVTKLEAIDDIVRVTENSLIVTSEIVQKVFTENVLNNEDLKENTTELNILENKIISSEELVSKFSNVIENKEVETVSNITNNEEVQKVSNVTEIVKDSKILKTEDKEIHITLKDLILLKQNHSENKKISSSSTESLESTTITIIENEMNTKPLVTLEEYAVKQMNFILDYLLIEIQEYVAKVLQASINTVFQRDNLKRYAEGLNRLLNPDTDNDYSDEFVEPRNLTQDEIYEEIILKLNFLKSKPSKYLQRQIPQDWSREYRNKIEELTIWLDKATEQMHREFNRYVSEKEDYIKHQYFNEAFDDISRATEIHQKLALLADLVEIVKNKKKITFMDLYMQN